MPDRRCDFRTLTYKTDAAGHDYVTNMHKSINQEKYSAVFLGMLRGARIAADMTQQDLATALGVDRTLITKVETGIRRLDPIETFEWLRCLGHSFAEFAAALEERLLALELRNSGGRRRAKQ
jgi:DNA-binding XRE family transcriptional regulator